MSKNKRKKILFVCGELPYPITSGGRRRELELLTELGGLGETEILSISRNLNSVDLALTHLKKYIKKIHIISAGDINESILLPRWNLEDLFKRFHVSEWESWWRLNYKRFNIIHVERGILIPPYLLDDFSGVDLIVSEQNILSETIKFILKRNGFLTQKEKDKLKLYLKLLIGHENKIWRRSSKIITISQEDANTIRKRIGCAEDIICVPPTAREKNIKKEIIFKKFKQLQARKKINLLYLGNFNYFPNIISIENIAEKVLPVLDKLEINYCLRIVGNKAEYLKEKLRSKNLSKVKIIGYTSNLERIWNLTHFSLCPVYANDGVKIKILESLENRVPVITNSNGLKGYERFKDKFIFVRDNYFEMGKLIKDFIENPRLVLMISERLRKAKLESRKFSENLLKAYNL